MAIKSKLNLIPFTTSKNGVLLGQILIKAFICINYLSQNIINEIEANKSENIYLTYNIEKDDEKNYKKLCDDSYLFSKKYEILDKDSFHEYPMNIFLGCISELIKKQDIENKEDKKRIIKKIIKYINLGGFIEVSKKYKNEVGMFFLYKDILK